MGREREKLCGICILCTSLKYFLSLLMGCNVLAVVLGACCSLGLYWCGWYIPWLSVSRTHWPVTAEMPLFCHVVTQKKLLCHAAGLGTGGGCACWWCEDKCHQFRVLWTLVLCGYRCWLDVRCLKAVLVCLSSGWKALHFKIGTDFYVHRAFDTFCTDHTFSAPTPLRS